MSGQNQNQKQQQQQQQLKEAHVVRVFFSSPFGGMEGEREELTRLYLPRLHSLCQARGLRFVAVDLRWGITAEAADSAQTLTICLRELDRADVFVGFYGQRYGWHSLHGSTDDLLARNMELAAGRYPWVKQYADRSVTELEFLHGHLNQPGSLPAIVCFRDKSYDDQMKDQAVRAEDDKTVKKYTAESPEAARLLQDLKKRCEKTKDQCVAFCDNYKTPADAAQTIFEALWQHLTSVLLKEDQETQSPLQRMRAEHDAFLRTRTIHYFDGEHYFRQLDQLHSEGVISGAGTEEKSGSKGGQPPGGVRPRAVVVTGPRGIGRSALLCNWLLHRRALDTDNVIIYHFVGTPSNSSGPKALMRRFLDELVEATEDLDTESGDKSGENTQGENPPPSQEEAKSKETTGSGNSEQTELSENATQDKEEKGSAGKDKNKKQTDEDGKKTPSKKEGTNNKKGSEKKDNDEENEKEKEREKEKEKEETLADIVDKFKARLKKVEESGRRVVLVIDGLEKVSKGHKSHKVLYWLPEGLPSCVTLVVSCLDSDTPLMEELVNVRRFHTLTVQPLARHTQQQLCVVLLQEGGKELSPSQLARIVEAPHTENPLYLTILLHELSVFGQFRKLDTKIDSLLGCKGVFELFDCFLQRLEESYNTSEFPDLVQKVCSAISLSQCGLSESELTEMFEVPGHLWSPLYFALDSYTIVLRSKTYKGFRFLFSELDDAVQARYLSDEDFKIKIKREMIEFFEKEKKLFRPWKGGKHESCQRAAEELPSLYRSLGDKEGLIRTITHLGVFSQIYDRTNGEYELLELWAWTEKSWGQIVQLYFQAFDEGVVESYLHYESLPPDSWETTPSYAMKGLIERINHIVDLGGGNAAAKESVLQRCIEICEGAEGKVEEKKRYEAAQSFMYDLACLYVDDERFKEAEDLHMKIYAERKKLAEENPDDKEMQQVYGFSCNGLGLLYYRMKNHPKATEFLTRSLEVHKKLGNKKNVADNHTNLGLVAMDESNHPLAKEHLETSVTLYIESNFGRKTHVLGNALTNLALLHRRMKNLNEAERMYFEALEIKKNAVGEFNPLVATCWMNLGTVAIHKKDPAKMEEYTRKALYILELNDAPEDSRTRWMCTENLLMALVKQDRAEEGLQMFNDLHAIMLRRDKINECLPFVHQTYVDYFLDRGMLEDAERVLFPLLRSQKRRPRNFLQLARLDKARPRPPTMPRPPELTLERGLELYPQDMGVWRAYGEARLAAGDKEGLLKSMDALGWDKSQLLEQSKACLEDEPPQADLALTILLHGAQKFDEEETLAALFDACLELDRHQEALVHAERVGGKVEEGSSDPPFPAGLLLKAATVALHCQQRPLALSLCDVIFSQRGDDDSTSEKARELLQKFGLEPRRKAQQDNGADGAGDAKPPNGDVTQL